MNPKDIIEDCVRYHEERKMFHLKHFYSAENRCDFDAFDYEAQLTIPTDTIIELEHVKITSNTANILIINHYGVYLICHIDRKLVQQCYAILVNKILKKELE